MFEAFQKAESQDGLPAGCLPGPGGEDTSLGIMPTSSSSAQIFHLAQRTIWGQHRDPPLGGMKGANQRNFTFQTKKKNPFRSLNYLGKILET